MATLVGHVITWRRKSLCLCTVWSLSLDGREHFKEKIMLLKE